MIRCPNIIETLANGCERHAHGTGRFPCAAFGGSLSDFLGGGVERHWHPDFEFFVLDEGSASLVLTDGERKVAEGDLVLVNSNAIHSMTPLDGCAGAFRSIVCDPSVLAGDVGGVIAERYIGPLARSGSTAWLLPAATHEAELAAFEAAYSALEEERAGFELTVRSGLSVIVSRVILDGGASASRRSSSQQSTLRLMLELISSAYGRRLTVEDIAAAGGVSVRECQRIFSCLLGRRRGRPFSRRGCRWRVACLSTATSPWQLSPRPAVFRTRATSQSSSSASAAARLASTAPAPNGDEPEVLA